MKKFGTGTGFVRRDFITKTELRRSVYNPGSKGSTAFRILPAPDLENPGAFQPQSMPIEPGEDAWSALSDSFCEIETVRYMGEEGIDYITFDMDRPDNISPAMLFYNRITDFVKEEGRKAIPAWTNWVSGYKGDLSRPSSRLLVQAAILKHQGKDIVNSKNKQPEIKLPVVVQLSRSAEVAMIKEIITAKDESQPLSAANCLIGDITSPEGGCVISCDPYKNVDDQTRYAVTNTGQVLPIDIQMCLNNFVAWEDLLELHGTEWHVNKLINLFGGSAVDYAFRETADLYRYVPEGYRGSYENERNSLLKAPSFSSNDAQLNKPQINTESLQPAQLTLPQINTESLNKPQINTESLNKPQINTESLQPAQLTLPQINTESLNKPQLNEGGLTIPTLTQVSQQIVVEKPEQLEPMSKPAVGSTNAIKAAMEKARQNVNK